VLDSEKPRRPREEEQAEINSLVRRPAELAAIEEARVLRLALADEVTQREADEAARLDARDREETVAEREAAERLCREEAEIFLEMPLLQARHRRRQATSPSDDPDDSWHERQAS
jgi:hypothetical protein